MSVNLDAYNIARSSTLKSKLEKRIEALEEADQIQCLILEHLNWYIETTNNQWEQ